MKNRKSEAPKVEVKLPLEAVTAIMNGAFTECADLVCIDMTQVPDGTPAEKWAAQRLLDGEAVRFYARETPPGTTDAKCWDVTLEMLRSGVRHYLTAGLWFLLEGDTLDAEFLEPTDAIPILLLAIFGGPGDGREDGR